MSSWKESTGNFWKPEKEGDSVQGLLVKVEEKVGPNESMLYHLEQKGGEPVQVWGSTVLNSRMAPVKEGQEVRITYKGLGEKGGRGKNKPKIFKVEYKDPDIQDITDKEEKEIDEALGL